MSTAQPAPALRVPAPVTLARVLLIVIAVSHAIVPAVMWANRGDLQDQIASEHPDFGAAELAQSADIAVYSAAVFHTILLALCLLLAWKLATGRPWTRRLTTISQLLSVAFSAVSWSSSPMFHAVIPIIGALQILSVALLWIPASARTFFTQGLKDPIV